MKKQITISEQVAKELGIKSKTKTLTICNDGPNARTVITEAGEKIDYFQALDILNENNCLDCGILGYNSLFYNDEKAKKSARVQYAEVPEIIGDTDRLELMVYSSFDEMNRDLLDCSFTPEPKYETI